MKDITMLLTTYFKKLVRMSLHSLGNAGKWCGCRKQGKTGEIHRQQARNSVVGTRRRCGKNTAEIKVALRMKDVNPGCRNSNQ